MSGSFKPFRLWEDEKDAAYIVRISPDKTSVELEWLSDDTAFEVCVFEKETLVKSVKTNEKRITIEELQENVEYSVVVKCASGESKRRLFITADYLGKVVNYLHPDDLCYAFSGRYIATPSIIRFQGDLYVALDVFRGGDQRGAFNLTLLYRSKDDGKTWDYVTDIVPSFWPTLFVANGCLCVLSVDTEAGSLLVMKSQDGENWSDPNYLKHGSGPSTACGMHKSATPFAELDGKLYFGLEYGGHGAKRFDSLVGCLDLQKDPLDKSAWTFSDLARVEFEWSENSDRSIRFAIEANPVERDGEIFVLSRFAYKKALMWKYDKTQPQKPLQFYKVVDFEAGHCKFYIQKVKDGLYYAMGNTGCYPRHVIKLYRSKDLENWETVQTLEDISERSVEKDGVQYPSFFMENGKFYTVLRNALHGAHTFHDSNAIVFKTYDIPSEE
jgi:hypothetical protein